MVSRVSAVDVGFTNSAGLVVVPLTITDHTGEAVSGVKGSQFRVLDNGESRPVVSFERDQRPLSRRGGCRYQLTHGIGSGASAVSAA
jgi:hypothetical protein